MASQQMSTEAGLRHATPALAGPRLRGSLGRSLAARRRVPASGMESTAETDTATRPLKEDNGEKKQQRIRYRRRSAFGAWERINRAAICCGMSLVKPCRVDRGTVDVVTPRRICQNNVHIALLEQLYPLVATAMDSGAAPFPWHPRSEQNLCGIAGSNLPQDECCPTETRMLVDANAAHFCLACGRSTEQQRGLEMGGQPAEKWRGRKSLKECANCKTCLSASTKKP